MAKGKSKREQICILIPESLVLQQKLTQRCKAIILQSKKKKKNVADHCQVSWFVVGSVHFVLWKRKDIKGI